MSVIAGSGSASLLIQTQIYALSTEARSRRLNTVFMTSYFLAGVVGASVAAFATEHFGCGLSMTGAGFAVLALAAHLIAVYRGLR